MVDLSILRDMGLTPERLRTIFTSKPPDATADLEPALREQQVKDYNVRQRFEQTILRRFFEQINFSLKNHQIYSAVDLAWDSTPINKATYPLMQYAQGQLDLGSCADQLDKLSCAQKYVTKDDKGNIVGVNLPQFIEVNVNLVRSVITRRLAAQSNKYSNLYPFYKFEPRSTSTVAKLRGDVMSQVVEVMVDNYGYRHHDDQVIRDMLLYGHCLSFPTTAWDKQMQWRRKSLASDFTTSEGNAGLESFTEKEGVIFTNPHPSRAFCDNCYAMSSLNTDTGCEYCGYWDVFRYGDIYENPQFWNREFISYSSNTVSLFTVYAQYFSNYYCTLTPPTLPGCGTGSCGAGGPGAVGSGGIGPATDLSSENDRKNNTGLYAVTQPNSAMIVGQVFMKIKPIEWGLCDYPYPIWMRLLVAGESTVVYAEPMPSRPALYCGYNEKDDRQVNISMAHELMSYQDHMTNLCSYMLMCLKSDAHKFVLIDTDVAEPEHLRQIRAEVKARNSFTEPIVVEYSGRKMQELGINPKDVLHMVETTPSQALNFIFKAMLELLQLVERLMAMSPQEQGQPAPREISATETNLIAGTTESVFSFIGTGIDEYRDAKKLLLYESYMACGEQEFKVPVQNRYTDKTIMAAGLEVDPEASEEYIGNPTNPRISRHTVIGEKTALEETYLFNSRDGAERSVNPQASQTLVQLLNVIQNPTILQAVGKEKLYEIINEIFRTSGAAFDLKLELKEGESNEIGDPQTEQMKAQMQQGGQQIQQLAAKQQQTDQTLQMILQLFQAMGVTPPVQNAGPSGQLPPPPGPQVLGRAA